jgi:uncharacterized protein YjbJ (UPF0337 family)
MINQQILEGNWTEIKGKLRKRWAQITENDIPDAQGNVEEIVGAIQRKTGETREEIEKAMHEVLSNSASTVSHLAEKASEYAQHATKTAQDAGKQAVAQVRHGYEHAENYVRDRPAESLVICFATGVVTGAVLTLALCKK